MEGLLDDSVAIKVSSTKSREFGKKNMLDESEETCWYSKEGTPQFIIVDFKQRVALAEVDIMFQGGFAGKTTSLQVLDSNEWREVCPLHPDDVNDLQVFAMEKEEEGQVFRLLFEDSTDFFGRLVVYKLKMRGKKLE